LRWRITTRAIASTQAATRTSDALIHVRGAEMQPPSRLNPQEFRKAAHDYWLGDWTYLATAETQHIDDIDADARGLALPKSVIDKIYYSNARREFLAKHEH
jgi:hypothetical protein